MDALLRCRRFYYLKLLRDQVDQDKSEQNNIRISGSFFATYVILSIIYYFFNYHSYKILLISFFITLGCQVGDLFFSFLKRKAKIKDTGKILPGHGGVLDRLDSIFFGLPIGFISLIIFLK